MRPYLELGRVSFKNNLVYRVDYLTGIINNILSIFVGVAIWNAIYSSGSKVQEIELNGLLTYVSLIILLQAMFAMDDFFLEKKIRTGEIAVDLLKPVNIKLYIFSYLTGTLMFKLLMQLVPSLLVVSIFFKILPPASVQMGVFFIISIFMGYLVLYNLNFIFWVSSFWFHVSWSVITIKEALIAILSGVVFPVWFMPQTLLKILAYTPFESIYFIPISLYLGRVPVDAVWMNLLKQGIWTFALYLIGNFLWHRGMKKLVVQGG